MATVSYFDFALVDNTRFEFQVRGEGKDFCCYFDFGRPIVLTDKTLTATLAIISGRAFDRIEVGHPLPPDCVEFLRSFCRAEIVPSASAPNLAVPYVPQKVEISACHFQEVSIPWLPGSCCRPKTPL